MPARYRGPGNPTRPTRVVPTDGTLMRAFLASRGALDHDIEFVVEGQNLSDSQTGIDLVVADQTLESGAVGIPVNRRMWLEPRENQVGVSWLSNNVPAGVWTLTLQRRRTGTGFVPVATCEVQTS